MCGESVLAGRRAFACAGPADGGDRSDGARGPKLVGDASCRWDRPSRSPMVAGRESSGRLGVGRAGPGVEVSGEVPRRVGRRRHTDATRRPEVHPQARMNADSVLPFLLIPILRRSIVPTETAVLRFPTAPPKAQPARARDQPWIAARRVQYSPAPTESKSDQPHNSPP